MTQAAPPVTQAVRVLRQQQIAFSHHLYHYEAHGGTAVSARELGVPEHDVIKTLVLEDERKQPLIMLMHGDCEVSLKNLARHIGVKTIAPCAPAVAEKHSGYQVGGTSPFGTKKVMPIYAEATILQCEKIFINGGKRGYLVGIAPADLNAALKPIWVTVAIPNTIG